MSKRKGKIPRVIWRKLGKERAWGIATIDPACPTIEIDSRLSPRRELETLTHESLHHASPLMTEAEVDRIAKRISEVLWKENFRRVLLGKHTTPVRISK